MTKRYLQRVGALAVAMLVPLATFAQGHPEPQPGLLANIGVSIGRFITTLVPVISSLALLAFFWGLAMYLFNFGEGKEDKQKQGRNLMLYGILVIFVMVSIFGIAQLLGAAFGINTTHNQQQSPTIIPQSVGQ